MLPPCPGVHRPETLSLVIRGQVVRGNAPHAVPEDKKRQLAAGVDLSHYYDTITHAVCQ